MGLRNDESAGLIVGHLQLSEENVKAEHSYESGMVMKPVKLLCYVFVSFFRSDSAQRSIAFLSF